MGRKIDGGCVGHRKRGNDKDYQVQFLQASAVLVTGMNGWIAASRLGGSSRSYGLSFAVISSVGPQTFTEPLHEQP